MFQSLKIHHRWNFESFRSLSNTSFPFFFLVNSSLTAKILRSLLFFSHQRKPPKSTAAIIPTMLCIYSRKSSQVYQTSFPLIRYPLKGGWVSADECPFGGCWGVPWGPSFEIASIYSEVLDIPPDASTTCMSTRLFRKWRKISSRP